MNDRTFLLCCLTEIDALNDGCEMSYHLPSIKIPFPADTESMRSSHLLLIANDLLGRLGATLICEKGGYYISLLTSPAANERPFLNADEHRKFLNSKDGEI